MKKKIIVLYLIIFSSFTFGQVIYVPLENGIYDFLERQNLKGNIILNDEIKPFSRIYIAHKLTELKNIVIQDSNVLNKVEQEDLKFYLEEYFYEVNKIEITSPIQDENKINTSDITNQIKERWYLFNYSDSLFNLKLSPIAGYEVSSSGIKTGHSRWIGFSAFSTYSDWFGASLDIRDKGEFGENVDKEKSFSEVRGAWYKNAPDGIEYSDVKGGITFSWSWGNVSLIKDYLQWGHGKFGQLILSDKAPSFPQVRLNLTPVPWLRFSYMHGWLNSLVIDSAASYYAYPGTISERLRESYISKYIAANLITVTPWKRIDISIGNAIVYSGDLRPEFFIPFMIFKFLDHNTGRGDIGDGNGMMFFDLSIKYPERIKFYSTLFIDVTEIRNILKRNFNNTWTGFTLGSKTIDLLLPNLDFTIEYTRINPWVYEHKDEVTTYKHLDYSLGHWLGQNSDQLRIQLNYQLLRGLKFMLYGEKIRKGGMDEIFYAYDDINTSGRSFLYGLIRKESRIGLSASYEYMHNLIAQLKYTYSDISDENIDRLNSLENSKNYFSLSVFYNL